MIKTRGSLPKNIKLPPQDELKHFRAVVKSLMLDTSMVLAELESLCNEKEAMEKINLLTHYLEYTISLCDKEICHYPYTDR